MGCWVMQLATGGHKFQPCLNGLNPREKRERGRENGAKLYL